MQVFEGERKFTTENELLGKFNLTEISKGPAGTIKIWVTLSIDENRILHVQAEERIAGRKHSIKIDNEKGTGV